MGDGNGTSSWIEFAMTPRCYEEMYMSMNYADVSCWLIIVSRVLGWIITGLFPLVKIPQLVKIVRSKSGSGISLGSTVLGMAAVTIRFAYVSQRGYPFSTYGESVFVAGQFCMVGGLQLYYSSGTSSAIMFTSASVGVSALLVSGVVPSSLLKMLLSGNLVIILCSKLLQIRRSYIDGSTGQLSQMSMALQFSTTVARTFTSMVDTGESVIIMNFAVAAIFNAVILGQIMYYKSKKKKL